MKTVRFGRISLVEIDTAGGMEQAERDINADMAMSIAPFGCDLATAEKAVDALLREGAGGCIAGGACEVRVAGVIPIGRGRAWVLVETVLELEMAEGPSR